MPSPQVERRRLLEQPLQTAGVEGVVFLGCFLLGPGGSPRIWPDA